MSVIAEICIPTDEFQLGRIMDTSAVSTIELESLVPAGERAVPYLWVYEGDFEAFEEVVEGNTEVQKIERVDTYDDRVLYTLGWGAENDRVFRAIQSVGAYVLNATGLSEKWTFELRFPDHDAMSRFQERCRERDVNFEVMRLYSPSKPDLGPWFGLTEPQREALVLAVEEGYYDIPRNCTTAELAAEMDISDQAVTERLRRAIVTLSSNTVLTTPER